MADVVAWRRSIQSPAISALTRQLADSNVDADAAIAAFWSGVAQQGTPLIETMEDGSPGVCVTFLWRSADPTLEHVAICGALVISDHAATRLQRIDGTDIFWRSLSMPEGTRTSYLLSPNDSLAPFNPWTSQDGRADGWVEDPLNNHPFSVPASAGTPAVAFSQIEIAPLPALKWAEQGPNVLGTLEECWFESQALGCRRRFWLYLPPNGDDGLDMDCVWALDGLPAAHHMPVPVILEKLVAEGQLGRTAAVLIDSHDSASRQQHLLYDDHFVAMIRDELAPLVRSKARLSNDPQRNVITGMSAGGGMALYLGLVLPEIFGNVLAQSSACAYPPKGEHTNWLANQFLSIDRAPMQIYLDIGVLEVDEVDGIPSLLKANKTFAKLLARLGHKVTLRELNCGHDLIAFREDLGTGLPILLGRV